MFRVVILSIVLTLAAGPQTSLLCRLWCPPSDAATTECDHHDQAPSPSVTGDDSCSVEVLNTPGFIREDGPRVTTGSDAAHGVPVPHYRLMRPTSALLAVECGERAWALERRPLETALRL